LIFNYLIFLHWTFFNGECVITYIYKKLENPGYIPGSNLHDNELKNSFKDNTIIIDIFTVIQNLLVILNFYIISKRNKISPYVYIPYIIIFELYFYGLHFFEDHHINDSCILFQETIKYTLIFGMVYLLLSTKFNYHTPKAKS